MNERYRGNKSSNTSAENESGRIHNTPHYTWKYRTIDQHASDIELDSGGLLCRIKHVERRLRRGEDQRRELVCTLCLEMIPGGGCFEVLADCLIERDVLVIGNVILRAGPQRLVLVQQLPVPLYLLASLGRGLCLGTFLIRDGRLFLRQRVGGGGFVVRYFNLSAAPQVDRVVNELAVPCNQLLQNHISTI